MTPHAINSLAHSIHASIRRDAIIWYFTEPTNENSQFNVTIPDSAPIMSPTEEEQVKEVVLTLISRDIHAVIAQATKYLDDIDQKTEALPPDTQTTH